MNRKPLLLILLMALSWPLALSGQTYFTQTSTSDFMKGTGTNTVIANNCVSLQQKMASVADWSATTNLPQTLESHQVVTWRNYVYCVGGFNGSNPVNNVYRATQQDNGISGWSGLNGLPVALRDMGVAATQTQLVVIGGRNNDTVSNKIYSAPFNDDGSIGSWQELSVSLPQPCWGMRAVEALGSVYIIGGANTDSENDATNKVYRLKVNAVGEISGIVEVNSLPAPRNGHAVTVYDSKIIVTGGYDASHTAQNTVYSATVNVSGTLGSWSTKAPLTEAVYDHTTVCANGILTVIGGHNGSLPSNKFYYANADATTYSWTMSDVTMPERYFRCASFAFGNKIFLCGGEATSGTINNLVSYMAVTTSSTPVKKSAFIGIPYYIGTPKTMQELNYTLTNPTSKTYEILYRTAGEDKVFSSWTSAGSDLPAVVNQSKSYIQYMFRVTATGANDFSIDDVTLTVAGYKQLEGNLNDWGDLTLADSPYLVTGDISFTSGSHNIAAGVTIMFMPNTGMNIGQASVNFNGTQANPILLTAYESGNGSWNGVYFQDASDNGVTSVMNYTTIEKAGNGSNAANLRLYYTNQPTMSHCTFKLSTGDAAYFQNSSPTLTSCTFSDAPENRSGLALINSSPNLTSCTISNNSNQGLHLNNSAPTCNNCTMTGNMYGIYFQTTNFNATFSGVTCSNNQFGLYSCTPNRSFTFGSSEIVFTNNEADIAVAGGQIGSDQTWNNYPNCYALLGNVEIYGGTPKLTVQAGTTIKGNTSCGLYVGRNSNQGGMLYAVGTTAQPITFTSLNGEVGGWDGVRFRDGSDYSSNSSLRHCVVEKGVHNLVCSSTNQPSVMWCTFQDAQNHNVDLSSASISIEGSTIKNAPQGLWVSSSSPTLVSVVFENHSEYCVYNNNECNVTYSDCTMKDSHIGIRIITPNRDMVNDEYSEITFQNNIANIGVPEGHINVDRIWEANSYAIFGDLYVGRYRYDSPSYCRLTLMPGVTLKFAEGKYMRIGTDWSYPGDLNAEGTAEQSITFTSLNGEAGGWNGLVFGDYADVYSEQESILRHCIVENGNEYNLYMYESYQPSLIENCIFQNSNGIGLYLDSYSTPVVSKSIIKNNASHGIYMTGSNLNPTIGCTPENANSIYGNGGYQVYHNGNQDINMTYNFWGQPGYIQVEDDLVYDKLDDPSKGRITVYPTSVFPMEDFGHVQGTFRYSENKLMTNREMNIISVNDSIMATANSNANGQYDFSNYNVSVYNTLDNDFGVDILAGVNATDALLAMRHYVHLDTLTGSFAAAADVNQSGNINGTDAMLIMRRAIGESFPSGDFYYYNPSTMNISGDTCHYDLSFLCFGDVNGSYTPQGRDNNIELLHEGQLVADSYQEMEVPVSIKQAVELGALTLRFVYPVEFVEIEDVVLAATGESLLFTANNGLLTIVWFSLEPLALSENDELVVVKVHTKDLSSIEEPIAFSLGSYSELTDGNAQVLEDVVIAMPVIVTETLSMGENTTSDHVALYPNPTKDICTLAYELPEAGRVTVSVYNLMGVKVLDAANSRMESGHHELRLSTASLASGMYSCRITFEGESSWVKTIKLIIEK